MKYLLIILGFQINLIAGPKADLPKELPFKIEELKQAQHGRDVSSKSSANFSHRISGQITAASKSSLSFRVPGFMQKIIAKPGDIVKKGEALAELDPKDFELQVSLARVNKAQALLQESMARNEYNREKQLHKDGASPGAQLEQAEFRFKQGQIGVQQAEINLKTAERSLEHTKLKAPYDCVVATQNKDHAERIGVETPVFDIYELNSTEVHLNVPEILMGKVLVGTKLSVFVPSVNYKEEAIVSKVVPVVSENTRTFKVTATLKNSDKKVVPGLFAEAQLN